MFSAGGIGEPMRYFMGGNEISQQQWDEKEDRKWWWL
jgi:hypothetical protein